MKINVVNGVNFYGSGYINIPEISFVPYTTAILTNNGSDWIIINYNQIKYYPTQVINIRSFSDTKGQSLLISSTTSIVPIYSCSFTPFSNNSTINVNFNVVANISGPPQNVFESNIIYNSNKIKTNTMINPGGNNIPANPNLFPILISYNNTSLATQTISISGGCRNSNGGLAVSNPWTLTITATQN